MEVQISLETRICRNCRKPFKVMMKSSQQSCSKLCAEYGTGTPVRGEQKKELKKQERAVESVTVSVTKPKKIIEGVRPFPIDASAWSTRKNRNNGQETTIIETRKNLMQNETNVKMKTESIPLNFSDKIIEKTPQKMQPKNDKEETKEIQPGLSEGLPTTLNKEGLTSVQLLRKSASKLMNLMDECVSESDLEKAKEGTQRVETHRIQTAVNCADSLTQIVQTQVNLLKVMTDLMKAKDQI